MIIEAAPSDPVMGDGSRLFLLKYIMYYLTFIYKNFIINIV